MTMALKRWNKTVLKNSRWRQICWLSYLKEIRIKLKIISLAAAALNTCVFILVWSSLWNADGIFIIYILFCLRWSSCYRFKNGLTAASGPVSQHPVQHKLQEEERRQDAFWTSGGRLSWKPLPPSFPKLFVSSTVARCFVTVFLFLTGHQKHAGIRLTSIREQHSRF